MNEVERMEVQGSLSLSAVRDMQIYKTPPTPRLELLESGRIHVLALYSARTEYPLMSQSRRGAVNYPNLICHLLMSDDNEWGDDNVDMRRVCSATESYRKTEILLLSDSNLFKCYLQERNDRSEVHAP